jgi:hypothetical protein
VPGLSDASGIDRHSVVRPVQDQVSTDVGGDSVILHVGEGHYYGLNEVASRAWQLMSERDRTIGELVRLLTEEYDVSEERCERDIIDMIRTLLDRNLVEVLASPQSSPLDSSSH